MPDLKLSLKTDEHSEGKGLLVKWVKELGDWVRKHEAIAVCLVNGNEISLQAPVQGVLQKIFVAPNAYFEPGAVLGILKTVMGGT